MSLGNADSFSRYGTGATSQANMVLGKWSAVGSGSSCETANPPVGATHHLRVGPTTNPIEPPRDAYGAALTEVIHAARFYPSALPGSNQGNAFWTLRDAANADQVSLVLASTGHIILKRGGVAGTVLATSTDAVFTAASYQFLEWFVSISNTVGECDVRYNGEPVAGLTGLTGLDTQETANAEVSQYLVGRATLGGGGLAQQWDIADEMWIITTDATAPDSFQGDVSWRFYQPTSDGALTDFARNAGAADYECIDDVTQDGDTTYIESSTIGAVSNFGVANLPATASSIIGVIGVACARKSGVGTAELRTSITSTLVSPDVNANGVARALVDTYSYYQDIFPTDPATGVAWTPTAFNAALMKFEKTA